MTNNKQQTEMNAVEYLDKVNQFAKENNTGRPKQQTAVEWYAKQIEILHYDYFTEHISKDEKNQRLKQLKEQAKEMEKKRMIDFADNYVDNCVIPNQNMAIPTIMDVPNYYEQTYGGGNK
jgi:uncharacterized membrane protein YgaE (UPF0421/DUF939 family)